MSRPRWYAERDAFTATVETGAQVHRVSWRRGRLRLHDHDVAAGEVHRRFALLGELST